MEIEAINYLNELEKLFLKYYLDKACLSILEDTEHLELGKD
jgi:hypothetical protein